MTATPVRTTMVKTTYREALREAIREALQRDERVFLMGEDVGAYGGCFGVSLGLLEEFGPERVRDTPLSESAFVGAGIGAAIGGLRPIVEVMTVNFSLLALDQIMNTAASLQHMSGGQYAVPLVIRMTTGAGRQLAAQHSHSLEGWYAHIPGLRIVTPATLEDARGMLWTALQDPDPVLIFEHGSLYNVAGELPADAGAVDLDRAAVRRAGDDLTLITYGGTLGRTLEAAEELATSGVECRGRRPAHPATAGRRHLPRLGHPHPPRRDRRRGLALGQPVGGAQRSDHRAGVLRPRRTRGAGLHRGGAHPLRPAPGGGGAAPGAGHPRRGAPDPGRTAMSDFTMPSLGADMEQGTVLEWLVAPGDVVHKGDPMAVVDTSKAAVEVETFVDGVVVDLIVPVGSEVPVGTVLAHLAPVGADAPRPQPAPEPGAGPVVAAEKPSEAPPSRAPAVHSPLVRRRAAELGVDLGSVAGTGPGGEITREDVEGAAEPAASPPPAPAPAPRTPPPRTPAAPTPAAARGTVDGRPRVTPYARRLARELGIDPAAVTPHDGETVRAGDVRAAAIAAPAPATPRPATSAPAPAAPASAADAPPPSAAATRAQAMRETIARLMARSKREIPHYYLTTTVDLTGALDWMREQNAGLSIAERLVPAALLLRATALATARHPALNGFWVDDAFVPGSGVHLGVAVSLRGGGLVAPAIHDADRLSVAETMAAMRDLVTRARAGRLRGTEMADPTLTVTNLGEQGVESVYGVIYPPQVALVGFGRVVERPWSVDGLLGVRPLTTVTLAADHRATDGFTGGRFLATVADLLQHPEEL